MVFELYEVIDVGMVCLFFFFFKQKTAYEMRISDWSSDVCSSDLALDDLGRGAGIVVLTKIGEEGQAGRVEQLRRVGIDCPVICNQGVKGPPLAAIIDQYRPSVAVFVDDLGMHHESSAIHAPGVWRLHMVGEPELAPNVVPAPFAHARIRSEAH